MSRFRVFVDGQEGTTGLQIVERLNKRSDVQLLEIEPALRKDPAARKALLNQADVAFLCLPDEASRESVALVDNPHTCVIDASTAFRTHPDWAYGLPELSSTYRERITKLKRIAVPGCHASAFLLLVHPLIKAGLINPSTTLDAFSLTGYSGGGKKMIAQYQQPDPLLQSPRPYALGLQHKHLPEMTVHAGLNVAPLFVPVVANFYKGLAVSVYVPAQQWNLSPQQVHHTLQQHYQNQTFVQVLPLDSEHNLQSGYLDVQACNDTNRADLMVFGGSERMVLVARIDNLGKGASGAAIQCMNLHLGLPENLGL